MDEVWISRNEIKKALDLENQLNMERRLELNNHDDEAVLFAKHISKCGLNDKIKHDVTIHPGGKKNRFKPLRVGDLDSLAYSFAQSPVETLYSQCYSFVYATNAQMDDDFQNVHAVARVLYKFTRPYYVSYSHDTLYRGFSETLKTAEYVKYLAADNPAKFFKELPEPIVFNVFFMQ